MGLVLSTFSYVAIFSSSVNPTHAKHLHKFVDCHQFLSVRSETPKLSATQSAPPLTLTWKPRDNCKLLSGIGYAHTFVPCTMLLVRVAYFVPDVCYLCKSISFNVYVLGDSAQATGCSLCRHKSGGCCPVSVISAM